MLAIRPIRGRGGRLDESAARGALGSRQVVGTSSAAQVFAVSHVV